MKFITGLFVWVAALAPTGEAILNGISITSRDIQYFVELFARDAGGANARRCGGVLIGNDLVLTAANCCFDSTGAEPNFGASLGYVMGANTGTTLGSSSTWSACTRHPGHAGTGTYNENVAVIKLTNQFPNFGMARLPGGDDDPNVADNFITYGFGLTSVPGSDATTLQKTEMIVAWDGEDNCMTGNSGGEFCGWSLTADVCTGDEGAPMILIPDSDRRNLRRLDGDNERTWGIQHQNADCIANNAPFAEWIRVSFYRPWIWQTTCGLSGENCGAACAATVLSFIPGASTLFLGHVQAAP